MIKESKVKYIAPELDLIPSEIVDSIATSGDIDNYNNEDYQW